MNRTHRFPKMIRIVLTAALLIARGFMPATAQSGLPPASPFTAGQLAAIAREAGDAAAQALESTKGSAIAIALGDGGGAVWAGQFGFADRASAKAPDADTMFGIGSTSKMFATAAAMILVDRGLVALDAPIVGYLPYFRMATPGYEKITVRMLLNHSAGFPGTDYRNGLTRAPMAGYTGQVVATLAESRLKHEPGWMSVYANDGFTLVELIVKAVTGLDYPDFVDSEILKPLGMSHSRYPLTAFPEGLYAKPYKEGQLLPQEYVGPLGSGGLYSTPSDLARFAAMVIGRGSLDGRRILSPESIAAMAMDQTEGSFSPLRSGFFRNGLGWDSVAQEGMASIGVKGWEKGGDTSSYGAAMIVLPEEGLSVAVTGASGIGSGIAKAIGEKVLARALVEKGRLRAMPVPAAPSPGQEVDIPPEVLGDLPGIYVNFSKVYKLDLGPDGSLSMKVFGNGIWAEALGTMTYRADGWFSPTGENAAPVDLRWLTADGRDYVAVRMPGANGWHSSVIPWGQKIEPAPPLSPAWSARIGKTWLPVNYSFGDDYIGPGVDPRVLLSSIEGAEGYVFSSGPDGIMTTRPAQVGGDSESHSFILIPQINGRDLFDVKVIRHGSEEWIRESSTLYRPLDSVPAATIGENAITIGPEGFIYWLRLPAGVRFKATGAAFKLYDEDFAQMDSGPDSTGPKAGYLALFGLPGALVKISVTR